MPAVMATLDFSHFRAVSDNGIIQGTIVVLGGDAMLEDPRPVPPPVLASAQVEAPSPEAPPAGEAVLPPPTAAQVRAADDVFTAPPQRDPAATLLGVLTSAMLLRDLAVDNFSRSAENKREKQNRDESSEPPR